MAIHVQKLTLATDQDSERTLLDWPKLNGTEGWKALSWVRNKPTWIEPTVYPSLSAHPDLGSSLLLLKSSDETTTLAIYPVSTLSANNNLLVHDGKIVANTRRVISGSAEDVWVVCVEATSAANERDIVKTAVEQARTLVGGRHKEESTCDSIWDIYGSCTWESLGKGEHRPTKDLLLSLHQSPPLFLIDDGWQDIVSRPTNQGEDRSLNSFGPWADFGGTMSEVVSELKDRGVKEVGVWLTLQGYWGGINPDSALIDRYDCRPHPIARRGISRGGAGGPMEEAGDVIWLPHPDQAKVFWLDWFTKMKSWGIGFVKVDNQAGYDALIGTNAAHNLQALWSGMLEAVVAVWGSLDRVIICMSHNDRSLNGPGGLDADRPHGNLIFRNSDDFNLSGADSHSQFVFCNVYSTILSNHLSFIPDFDMFCTNQPSLRPLYHALLRSLGPGPILLSDTPAVKTDALLLQRIFGKDHTGQIKTVQPDSAVAVLLNRWFSDNIRGGGDGPALVAGVPMSKAHGALIGVWNTRNDDEVGRAIDKIVLKDVEDAIAKKVGSDEYAIWSNGLSSNGRKVELVTAGWTGAMDLVLGTGECEMVVVAQVWQLGVRKVAVLGMLDKLAPLAGIAVELINNELVIRSRYQHTLGLLAFDQLQIPLIGQTGNVRLRSNAEDLVESVEGTLYSIDLHASESTAGGWVVTIRP